MGNSLCVVSQIIGFVWCWARPRFLLFAFASRGETQIWLGDLRVVCRFVVLSVFLVRFTDLLLLFYRGTTAFHCEIFNSFDTFTPILGPGLRATSAVPEEKDI